MVMKTNDGNTVNRMVDTNIKYEFVVTRESIEEMGYLNRCPLAGFLTFSKVSNSTVGSIGMIYSRGVLVNKHMVADPYHSLKPGDVVSITSHYAFCNGGGMIHRDACEQRRSDNKDMCNKCATRKDSVTFEKKVLKEKKEIIVAKKKVSKTGTVGKKDSVEKKTAAKGVTAKGVTAKTPVAKKPTAKGVVGGAAAKKPTTTKGTTSTGTAGKDAKNTTATAKTPKTPKPPKTPKTPKPYKETSTDKFNRESHELKTCMFNLNKKLKAGKLIDEDLIPILSTIEQECENSNGVYKMDSDGFAVQIKESVIRPTAPLASKSRSTKLNRCICCDEECNPGKYFRMGHDARIKGVMNKLTNGKLLPKDANPAILKLWKFKMTPGNSDLTLIELIKKYQG